MASVLVLLSFSVWLTLWALPYGVFGMVGVLAKLTIARECSMLEVTKVLVQCIMLVVNKNKATP